MPWRSQVNDAYLSFPVTCCCADAQAHGAAIIYAAPQAETVNSVAAWKQKVDEALDGQLPTIAIANKVRVCVCRAPDYKLACVLLAFCRVTNQSPVATSLPSQPMSMRAV